MFFHPLYLLFVAPALLLAAWAQLRVRSTFAAAMRMRAPMSGVDAARHILDQAGCGHVQIEETGGMLTDHYDPRHKVLRLSSAVFHTPSLAAVGIAAHEAGHAIQDARSYAPLGLRNMAVPAAQFGPMLAILMFVLGGLFHSAGLIWAGIAAFSGVLVFQLFNLPVEFDASRRAREWLARTGIVRTQEEAGAVSAVLDAAAWTYVAATLQALLTLLYYVFLYWHVLAGHRDRR